MPAVLVCLEVEAVRRILVGFIMDGKGGGVDRYLLNFLEAVYEEDVQIDFLTDGVHDELEEYLEKYHSGLYPVAGLRHPVRQFKQVCNILRKKRYDMVYLNISTAIDCIAVFAARHMGVPERMVHSHSSGNDRESAAARLLYNAVHYICRLFCWTACTRFYACSGKAGEWIFPKKIVSSDRFEVIYNAVDRKKFYYDEKLRREVRKELGAEEDFVIGHIGSFSYAKNYPFLISVFEEIYKKDKKSRLLLIGSGVEEADVRCMVKEKGLQNVVSFLGWCSDTWRLYQAMDLFLLPSRFEGLPIVGIEAQCTKLACVFSDAVTEETKISEESYFLGLKESPAKWADFILKHREYDRENVKLSENAEHYSLESQAEQLRRIICP